MRVSTDGLILAANDAAMGMFGAQQRSEILGGILTTWIVEAHRERWTSFSRSVAEGASQSFECDLAEVGGVQRSVVFHGVPMLDHPDGIPSLILGARDASAQRRLETALHESETGRQKLAEERSQSHMTDVSGRVQELEASLQKSESERSRLERALVQLPQLEQLLKQGRTHLQALRVKLDETSRERDQLAARVTEREAAHEQLWNEQANLQLSLEGQQQRELEDLRLQLRDAIGERDQASARLAEGEAQQAHLQSERDTLRTERDEARAERDQLRMERDDLRHSQEELRHSQEGRERESDQLRTSLADAVAEKEQLVSQLAERIAEHERSLLEREERQHAESAQQQQVLDALRLEMDGLRTESNLLRMERDNIASQLSDVIAAHERAVIEHSAQHTALRQSVDEYQQELFGVQAQFEDAAAERDRLMKLLDDSAAQQRKVAAEYEAERSRFEETVVSIASQQRANEKVMADHRLELQSVDQAARSIEPLAAAGRLAIDVARELVTTVADIDARTACLVAECPVDSMSREEVEQLRADAVRAGSLARQILHASRVGQVEETT
jgi:chromosome segregation ATPase